MIRSPDAPDVRVGFFGKLPSRGDFVRNGVSRALASAWDRWLQTVMPGSARELTRAWSKQQPDTPAWRFAFGAGVCGPHAACGLWLPSADRVGRAFPLLIAAELAVETETFLDAAERAGMDAIRRSMTPEALAIELSKVPRPPPAPPGAIRATARWWRTCGAGCLREICGDGLPDSGTFERMLTT